MEKQPIVIDCGNCEYNDGTGRCDPNNCHKIPGMSTHQFNVILRGICNGAALRNKQPEILTDTKEIVCAPPLDIWAICAISSDAEAFGLKAEFHYDGKSRIVFTPAPQKREIHIVKQYSTGSRGAKYTYIRGYYSTKELAEHRGQAIVTNNTTWDIETIELNKDI